MTFEQPLLLVLAPLGALLAGGLAWAARRARVRAAAGWSSALGAEAAAHGRRGAWLLAAVGLAAGVGLAGPRWGLAEGVAESRALNVVLVMDISRSMLAQDAPPSRLGRAVGVARRLVQDLDGDRLGLVAFAARPYLLSPLTLDQSALALQLDALDPDVASEGGSAVGAALEQARAVLDAAIEGGDKAVVLLTDGESFDGERALADAGAALRGAGITLVTVPVGTPEGARIPTGDGGWHRDAAGSEVVTVRRDDLLAALTEAAQATLVAADAPDPSGEVRRVLDRLERATARDRTAADLVPRAWLLALLGAALLAIHTATRRGAALAGLLLLAAAGDPAAAQRPGPGTALLRRGDTVAAGRAFLEAARRRGGDTAWYNAGTAALVRGEYAAAREALARAGTALDPDLRRRALYNLGTAMLLEARRDSTRRDSLLAGAEAQLRAALQLDPGDAAAKFNYELARRLRPPPPPSGGGGTGEGGGGNPPPPPARRDGEGMTPEEAEQVLGAMERAERQTRQDLARRQRRGQPPTGPDW